MLHIKFRGNRSSGSLAVFKAFDYIRAWRPALPCDHDTVNKFSFPLPREIPHIIWL